MKILISACLTGERVRYDNRSFSITAPILLAWQREGLLVSVCPEVIGGLGIPRPPAEISGGSGKGVLQGKSRIINRAGDDVTPRFIRGAKQALSLAKSHQVSMAILKAKSPSCGSELVYDGSFTGRLVKGKGVTAALLEENAIPVFSEKELQKALVFWKGTRRK